MSKWHSSSPPGLVLCTPDGCDCCHDDDGNGDLSRDLRLQQQLPGAHQTSDPAAQAVIPSLSLPTLPVSSPAWPPVFVRTVKCLLSDLSELCRPPLYILIVIPG